MSAVATIPQDGQAPGAPPDTGSGQGLPLWPLSPELRALSAQAPQRGLTRPQGPPASRTPPGRSAAARSLLLAQAVQNRLDQNGTCQALGSVLAGKTPCARGRVPGRSRARDPWPLLRRAPGSRAPTRGRRRPGPQRGNDCLFLPRPPGTPQPPRGAPPWPRVLCSVVRRRPLVPGRKRADGPRAPFRRRRLHRGPLGG